MNEKQNSIIVNAIEDLVANQNAQQIILLGIIAQIIGMKDDWRERLTVMRGVAERGIANLQLDSDADNDEMRQKMYRIVCDRYNEIERAMLQWEAVGRPSPYPQW